MAGKRILLFLVVGFQVFACIYAGGPFPITESPPPHFAKPVGSPRFGCTKSNSSHNIDAKVPGEVVSPGYPASYSNNQDCTWKLKAPLGSIVRVTITKLDLDQHDTLTISDGETPLTRNLIGKYSLCMKGSLSLFSTGNFMYLKFKSNNADVKTGFRIEYKAVRKDKIVKAGKVHTLCSFNSVVRGTSGYMAHPGFPDSILKGIRCVWTLKATSGKSLHLSYKSFGLIPASPFGSCVFDSVQQTYGWVGQVKSYCGCDLPKNTKGPTGTDLFTQVKTTSTDIFHQPGFLLYYKALDRSTCPNPESCAALDDDRNVGFDRDANIIFEKKEVPVITTTAAPVTTVPTTAPTERPPMGPFHVKCNRDEMKVALNFTRHPLIIQESATLIDHTCKSYHEDATHVYIRAPLDGCGTYHNYSSDGRYIIYYNEFLFQPQGVKAGDIITRDHLATFKFECRYHRRAIMSVVHYTPSKAKVYTTTENFGNFTFMMRMFKNKDYKEAYDDYPVNVLNGKKIYIQTEVIATDTELVLLVEQCHATPSEDYNDKEYHDLIEKGCEKDETLEYKHKLSPIQRFNFKSFHFEHDKDANIHIHCKVRICRKVDKNSRCVENCPETKKRRRREADPHEETEITGRLSIGPVDVQEDSQTGKLRGSDTPRMFVEIMIAVLGFIVIALLIAVSTVLWKKRQQQNKSNLSSLIVEDN